MRKDKYGRQYNRPIYIFAVLLIIATIAAIMMMRLFTD